MRPHPECPERLTAECHHEPTRRAPSQREPRDALGPNRTTSRPYVKAKSAEVHGVTKMPRWRRPTPPESRCLAQGHEGGALPHEERGPNTKSAQFDPTTHSQTMTPRRCRAHDWGPQSHRTRPRMRESQSQRTRTRRPDARRETARQSHTVLSPAEDRAARPNTEGRRRPEEWRRIRAEPTALEPRRNPTNAAPKNTRRRRAQSTPTPARAQATTR
jgi:hypothetical protein